MPSAFERAWRSREGLFDARMGEAFELTRQAPPAALPGCAGPDVNARRVARPNLAPIPFVGIFETPGAELHADGRSMAATTTHTIAGAKLSIDAGLAALGGYRPVEGDAVLRKDTGERFRVAACWPIDQDRMRITLVEKRAPAP